MFTVKTAEAEFPVEEGQSVLAAALAAGEPWPYACRSGHCGLCKARVLRGQISQSGASPQALSAAEQQAGYALMCVAHAESDLEIEPRRQQRLFPVQITPARVHDLTLLAPDIMRLLLKPPGFTPFRYAPGQYVDFLLEDGQRRSFSIANAPADDGLLEFHIRRVPGGLFTERLFTTIKLKDILRLEGPLGDFHFDTAIHKPVLMLASGTGFAPMQAMLQQLRAQQWPFPVSLYWRGRTPESLYATEALQALTKAWPAFRYIPLVASQERRIWPIDVVLQEFANLSNFRVYAAGHPAMIESACEQCEAHGLDPVDFCADAFPTEGTC